MFKSTTRHERFHGNGDQGSKKSIFSKTMSEPSFSMFHSPVYWPIVSLFSISRYVIVHNPAQHIVINFTRKNEGK